MQIDNLNSILPFLTFNGDGDFYTMYIHKRDKDGNLDADMSIFPKCISWFKLAFSNAEVIKIYNEGRVLCDNDNSRLYINTSSRSVNDICRKLNISFIDFFKRVEKMDNDIFYNIIYEVSNHFPTRNCMVDIDGENIEKKDEICQYVGSLLNDGDIMALLNTPNGFHLLTKHFYNKALCEKYPSLFSSPSLSVLAYCNLKVMD